MASNVSFEPIKCRLFIDLVNQNLQNKTRKKAVLLFDSFYWSDFHQIKTFVISLKFSENFVLVICLFLVFESGSSKNTNFCSGVHLIRIATVAERTSGNIRFIIHVNKGLNEA